MPGVPNSISIWKGLASSLVGNTSRWPGVVLSTGILVMATEALSPFLFLACDSLLCRVRSISLPLHCCRSFIEFLDIAIGKHGADEVLLHFVRHFVKLGLLLTVKRTTVTGIGVAFMTLITRRYHFHMFLPILFSVLLAPMAISIRAGNPLKALFRI